MSVGPCTLQIYWKIYHTTINTTLCANLIQVLLVKYSHQLMWSSKQNIKLSKMAHYATI